MLGFLRVRVGGPAAPPLSGASRMELRVIGPRVGGSRRRARGAASHDAGHQLKNGVATQRVVDAQGGAGDSGPATIAPGAGAGIRTHPERAGDLPDGAVP